MTNKTTQKGNLARDGGMIAGGDISVTNHYRDRKCLIDRLYEEFRREDKENCNFQATIDSLQLYLDPIDSESQEDLSSKLHQAGRSDEELLFALRAKELFAKELARNRLSLAAQKIYAYVLGRVHVLFKGHVRPLIQAGTEKGRIDRSVTEAVLERVFHELGDNDLLIDYQTLQGVVYFLTGNCHIRWNRT